MNPIVLPLIDGALHIDNTNLEKYTTCPRSAQYRIFEKIEASKFRPAPEFGIRMHSALELRYRHLDMPLDQVQPLQLARLTEVFSDWPYIEDEYRNYNLAVNCLLEYNNHYPIEEMEVVKDKVDGQPLVERSFAVPLGFVSVPAGTEFTDFVKGVIVHSHFGSDAKVPVIWTGRIDLAYRRDGKLFLMDHKTTSMLGDGFYREFELSHQTHGYAYALEFLTGEPVFGYVINALGVRKPTKTGKGLEFERKSVILSREHLEEWHEDCLYIVQTMLNQAAEGYMPKHTKWCVGKYGTCEYFQACNASPSTRELILSSGEYKTVTWSPHHD